MSIHRLGHGLHEVHQLLFVFLFHDRVFLLRQLLTNGGVHFTSIQRTFVIVAILGPDMVIDAIVFHWFIFSFEKDRIERITPIGELNDIVGTRSDGHVVLTAKVFQTLDQTTLHVTCLSGFHCRVDQT